MATTITAGNATNGAAISSDNTGILELKTGTGAGTTAVTIGTNQAVTFAAGTTINGITVGRGGGSVATNTAVGASALAANTTASNNTAVGYQAALYATGDSNTYLGARAGLGNSGGSSAFNNVAIGESALASVTTGANQVAIGRFALQSVTTGAENVAVGYYSNPLGTGIQNVSIGTGTHSSASFTGNKNVAIGYQAGIGITTGSNNVILGGNSGGAGTVINATQSNRVIIADGQGNVKLWADANGQVVKPGQAAFTAVTNAGQTIANGFYQTFPFNTKTSSPTAFDIANNYNTGSYAFTAPQAGIYMFVVAYLISTGSGRVGAHVQLTGQLRGVFSYYSGNDTGVICTVIANMAAGDTCFPLISNVTGGNILVNADGRFTYFSGYFLG